MTAIPDSCCFAFQTLQSLGWWWLLVFLAAALCCGWSATFLITALLFWQAGDIFAEQHLRHYIHRNRV